MQVALDGRRRTNADRLVGETNVERIGIGGRVDGNSLDSELVESTDDANGDLASIGYQDT
jgi:hypothetical protein